MRFRLLLVDDEALYLKLMKEFLEKRGYEVETASSGEMAMEAVTRPKSEFALVILDYLMAGKNGAEVAQDILKVRPELFVVINSTDQSREALKKSWSAGAVEFIDKAVAPDDYLKIVASWCEKYRELHEVVKVDSTANAKAIRSIGLVGASNSMAEVVRLIQRYRKSTKNVIVVGESGTGKERIAQALHTRSDLMFRAINCASYNGDANLMEAELFGSEKGSFTGSTKTKTGILEEVGRGTVFMDEIHTLSYRAQQKLLRALQDKVIRPVGGNREIPVHFRLVVAVKPGLEAMVKSGEFLPDLYYRLNVLRIVVPPLRERPEDIGALVKYFCDRYNKDTGENKEFLAKAVFYFERYSWPGNVRELENSVERLCATTIGKIIGPEQLDVKFLGGREDFAFPERKATDRSFVLEREKVMEVLRDSQSQREAARRLGIARSTFHDYLKRLGIAKPDKGASNE